MKKKPRKLHVIVRTDILGRTIALCGAILNKGLTIAPEPLTKPKQKCNVCHKRKRAKDAFNKINV